MQANGAPLLLAFFLRDVIRAEAAWGFSHHGELCVVHREVDILLPLCSRSEVAHFMQRRFWPELAVAALSLDEVLAYCLPPARDDGVLIGVAVATDADWVTVPAEWLEKALRDCRVRLRA
jgi:hypothetical protein